MRIFLIAAEPSGDRLGSSLIAALRSLDRSLIFAGVGGEEMAAQGVASLFDTHDLAVLGIAEAIPKIALVWRRIQQTVSAVMAFRPDIVVTIDSPSFSLEIAERLHSRMPRVKLIHYAAPQVWAWKAYRAGKMARYLDHLLALLPFEPPFFEAHGLPTSFVGHPVAAQWPDAQARHAFRDVHAIDEGRPLLAVLPGSRKSELRQLLPVYKATLTLLADAIPDLIACIPTLPRLELELREAVAGWPLRTIVAAGGSRAGLFEACSAALAASGTVTLELAAADLPMVVAYKVNPITAAIARRVLKVRYVALPNLVLDKLAVPELVQENATPRRLADAVLALLRAPQAQKADLEACMVRLGRGGEDPALRAARVVLAVGQGSV